MSVEVVLCVLVTRQDVERMSLDLNIATNWHIGWRDELHVLVHILVLFAVEELAWNDSRVLLCWLVDRNGVISEVERDNKAAVNILWHTGIEPGGETQDVLVVIDGLEEINLWLLWYEAVHLSQGIDFVSETVVGWLLDLNLLWYCWKLNFTEWELSAVVHSIPLLGEFIDTLNHVKTSIGVDVALWSNFVGGKIVITNEILAWLVHIKTVWELLSAEKEGERIATIVGVMHLTDLNGIVG